MTVALYIEKAEGFLTTGTLAFASLPPSHSPNGRSNLGERNSCRLWTFSARTE